MADLDLDVIEARANAASPGPWRTHDTWIADGGYCATVLSGEGTGAELRAWLPTFSSLPGLRPRNVVADAAFIAHAREDVPALVAEVKRLRAARRGDADMTNAHMAKQAHAAQEIARRLAEAERERDEQKYRGDGEYQRAEGLLYERDAAEARLAAVQTAAAPLKAWAEFHVANYRDQPPASLGISYERAPVTFADIQRLVAVLDGEAVTDR